MRIAICEDDPKYAQQLRTLIHKWSITNEEPVDVSVYSDAETLFMQLEETEYDIFFLDIEMKRMTGMELAKQIRRYDDEVVIIFVTSHSSYSLEGYEVAPLHFLMKPVTEGKIFQVLDKAYTIYSLRGGGGVLIKLESVENKIPVDSILYISTMSHSTAIATSDGLIDAKETTQQELMKKLPPHFQSCHRTYIINMHKVNAVYNDRVLLSDDTYIPVSRRNQKKIQEYFIKLNSR